MRYFIWTLNSATTPVKHKLNYANFTIVLSKLAQYNRAKGGFLPHLRQRHIIPLLLKKLSFTPVVAIQGARQTGKSVLAREILPAERAHYVYVTFDTFAERDFAARNPDSFLAKYETLGTLAIDEAQKVPDIFDAVKLSVDQKRVPGKFLLLGSTEFSKLTRIRESLTGRLSRVRLYPLNAAETLGLAPNASTHTALVNDKSRISREQMMIYLDRGGFPGIFAVRSAGERHDLLKDWIDLTTQRDALQIPGVKIDSDLCLEILRATATLRHTDAITIANALKQDTRRVKTHIKVLTTLFVLNEMPPHRLGTGKPIYYLVDVALARFFGADFGRQLATWLVNEQLSQRAYRDDRDTKVTYYRTAKGSVIQIVLETDKALTALTILESERIDNRDLMILKAFRDKAAALNKRLSTVALGAGRFSLKSDKIEIYPWESVA